MLTYFVRRLLLMIPTLIGITFVIFSLIALSPGGIGAQMMASGGNMDASKMALYQAYLEDRYGLNDPLLVQYGRWLARLLPVKLGQREQVTPRGDLIAAPKELAQLPLPEWFPPVAVVEAPEMAPRERVTDASRETAQREFRKLETQYALARGAYNSARKLLSIELIEYAKAHDIRAALPSKGDVRWHVLATHAPDRAAANWPEIERLAAEVERTYSEANITRTRLANAFDAKPFAEAGLPIIPDVISIGSPDLGVAFSKGRPVSELIAPALPVTLLLNLIAFPIIYLIAIPSGMLAAARRGSWFDVLSGSLFVALWSIPAVWAGVIAIGYLASPQGLNLFPTSGLHDNAASSWAFLPTRDASGAFVRGWLLDTLWHLVLPVACLVYAGFAILAKQTRAAMLDNSNADYVRTAKAKGVARRDVVVHHVFRNSLLPIITMFVTVFPATLAGSVVIERIFSIPGMGSLILDGINQRDRELILANTFMIACVNLLALLLADLLYAAADPRVSYE